MHSDQTNLSLGLAGLARQYGITRQQAPSTTEAHSLLNLAWTAGVWRFDTAPGYDADRVLKSWMEKEGCTESLHKIDVTTKISLRTSKSVVRELARITSNSHPFRISTCLIHDWSELEFPLDYRTRALLDELREVRASGSLQSIGISAYDERDLDRALKEFEDLDVAQVPISVVDQRLLNTHTMAELHTRGILIEARSIFLQGLLLASPSGGHTPPLVHNFREAAHNVGMTALEAAVWFVRDCDAVDRVVVGCSSEIELRAILSVWPTPARDVAWDQFAISDAELLDPRKW